MRNINAVQPLVAALNPYKAYAVVGGITVFISLFTPVCLHSSTIMS